MKLVHKTIGWCSKCNIPVIDSVKCTLCSSKLRDLNLFAGDLKPIFPEEKERYNKVIRYSSRDQWSLPDKMCFESKGTIMVDGRKVFRICFDSGLNDWRANILLNKKKDLEEIQGSNLNKILDANEESLRRLEAEAVTFLERTISNSSMPTIASFSGGKDSACSVALVREIDKNIPAVFLNSTIEFPETVEYVHNMSRLTKLELIQLFPERDFFDLCSTLGPPSCFMPWCCQTQKFSTLSSFINHCNPNGILSVEGLRRLESRQRMNYKRVSINKVVPRKVTICPIIDWTTFEVWLYILWKRIPVNPLYELGFKRVGCWVCPHKGSSGFRLTELLHPELIKKWHDFLLDYANKSGKDRTWIDEGKWRSRREAYNLIEQHKKSAVDCSHESSFLYTVSRDVNSTELIEFMKIFGNPLEINGPTESQMSCCIDGHGIKIRITNRKIMVASEKKSMIRIFERQLLKALNCIRCGTCMGTCKAIEVNEDKFSINTDVCTNCLKCTSSRYLRMGCIALNYKKDRFVWKEFL